MEAGETSNGVAGGADDSRKETVNPARDNESVRGMDNDIEDRISTIQRRESVRSVNAPNRMTFQLVLPQQFNGPVNDDPQGFGTVSAPARRSRPPSRAGSVLESKSPGFVNTRLVNYNRGLSHQPSMLSTRSHQAHTDIHIPPPSTEEEKSKMTRRYFATVIAISYTLFLIVFAAISFIGDAFVTQDPKLPNSLTENIPQIFGIYMLTIGIAYFIFLYIDIRVHINKAKNASKLREQQIQQYQEQMMQMEENFQSSLELRRTANGDVNVQIPIPDVMMRPIKSISHRYCFQTGRHGEFLYLKLGAAWFAFGLLIHSILNLSYQIMYFTVDSECQSVLQVVMDIMFPIWAIIVLFFIFKYINVIINSYRGVARVLIMHMIGTALAFWIWTIVRETVDAINLKNMYDDEEDKKRDSFDPFADVRVKPMARNFQIECPGPDELNTIRRTISPYLYPFVIEFCILIVGIFYMMWANINHCPKKLSAKGHGHDHGHGSNHGHENHASHHALTAIKEEDHHNHRPNGGLHRATSMQSVSSEHCNNLFDHDNNYKSNIVVYADCSASSRGLFAGLVLMILKIVFIILLHIAARNPDYVYTGVFIDSVFELTVLLLLIVTTVLGYIQTSKLDINPHPISKLDDVLLFIAVPAFFSETIFSMLPAVLNGSILNIFVIMAQLIQILIQTPWIIDGLRRCSNSPELRKKMPGRELVMFLTIANVALWVYYTFSVKTADTMDERYSFYGNEIWSILNHLSLPLIMFYRFHASVCLVDIWKHSYEPGEFAH